MPQKITEPLTFRDLYPELDEAELERAEENFDRYIALAWRIYSRVRDFCRDRQG